MVKRKKNIWATPKGITAIIAMVAASGVAIVTTASYINLPERVEASETQIYDIQSYIQKQQVINDFYYQREQQVQQQLYYPNQRQYQQQPIQQQPPQYQEPPQRCTDWWQGQEYPVDCETWEWL